jgi:hypothetical protein
MAFHARKPLTAPVVSDDGLTLTARDGEAAGVVDRLAAV